MLKKVKNIFLKTDRFLYKKFGSDKSLKSLENIKEAQTIFSLIGEKKIKFVGGCVRKALSGEDIDDIDLASELQPQEIKKKLIENNIKVIETGISHGTVTVILNEKKFEITTLRRDVSTDGRHAKIEFTTNWEEDALRRDFTINAIYADNYGRIFDPANGISDLNQGKVKFISSPEERVQEDYLRILRYFRFFLQYSKLDHDKSIINIIKKNINGINKISNERIFSEVKKILTLNNFDSLFSNSLSKDIILNVFPQFKYYKRLKIIKSLSKELLDQFDIYLILALLIIDQSNDHEYFCHKYKTSNSIKERLKNISINYENNKNKKFYSESNIQKLIYLSNKNNVKDLLLFSTSLNKVDQLVINKLLNYLNHCKIPKFPISADYLKQKGYKEGPTLGQKLKSLEEEWIKNDFFIEKNKLDKSLTKAIKN